MATPAEAIEAITFTPEQFATLINVIIYLIIAVIGAAGWITYKVIKVEKDMENVLKNPYIKAFRDLEEKHAKENVERMYDTTLNTWEAEKKVSVEKEEEKEKGKGEDTNKK